MKKNWVTKRKILSFGLGLFLLATKGQASSECHFHLSQSLSKEALDSLVSAHSSGHYLVEILKKTVGDTPKIVVLVGEAHTKNKVASDLGKEILKHFNLRGLEGADEEKTVGGKFFLKAVDFLNAIAKLLSFGKNKLTEGSTIHDALVDRTPQETKAAMLRFLDTLNGHLNLDEMSDSELATLKIKIADKNKVEWFEGEAILNLLRTLRNDPEATSLPPTPRTINVELERGHKPDFGEHMTTVYVPTWISFCVASLCGSFLPETVEGVVRAGSLLMSTHVLLGNAATHAFPKIQTKSWAYLVNPLAGLGWARNHTMSQNIVRTIEKEESATMLVLVGKAHIPGMSHILRTRFGFENVNLPSESSLQGN